MRADHFHYVARNFLLDETVTSTRASSYVASGAGGAHANDGDWIAAHKSYLRKSVFIRPGSSMATGSETFELPDALSEYGRSQKNLHLVRVEILEDILRLAKLPPNLATMFQEMVQRLVNHGSSDKDALSYVTSVFEAWNRHRDGRPIFASFLDSVGDLFGDDPSGDQLGWEEEVRARLGLIHLDPPTGKMPIMVLRYSVDRVKPISPADPLRPLATPTVLDGNFLNAFCPTPRESRIGRALNLSPAFDEPAPEIVHPFIEFHPRFIFRVGVLESSSPRDLAYSRGAHILLLRDACNRPDYAIGTDSDIA